MGLFDRAELTRSRFLYGPEVHDDYAVWHMNEQIPAGYDVTRLAPSASHLGYLGCSCGRASEHISKEV